MNFLDKMERKYGRYAIRNLPMFIIATYVAGYLIELFMPEMLMYLMLDPYYILHGQVWRLVTWILIPPSGLDFFTIIMLLFYFSLGQTLERTWGSFRFNVYIFSGLIFTVIGAFLLYALTGAAGVIGLYFSTYYINMSIFLAFALTYPDMQVLLVSLDQGNIASRVAIVASLLNFVLFFLLSGRFARFSPHEVHRRQEYKRNVRKVQPRKGTARHKCAVCGRTEEDGDHLEFRFCSRCDGNYEYCQDHLFTHQHIKKQ